MKNIYQSVYLDIISQFNSRDFNKWRLLRVYKGIEIYINRRHVNERFNDKSRTSFDIEVQQYQTEQSLRNYSIKFLKTYYNQLPSLVTENNPQSFIFQVKKNLSKSSQRITDMLYFTAELQYVDQLVNFEQKKCFQFCISTFLPNIRDGKAYTPQSFHEGDKHILIDDSTNTIILKD